MFRWLVMTMWDKKQRRLVCPTVACKTLVDEQTVSFSEFRPDLESPHLLLFLYKYLGRDAVFCTTS